MTNNVPAQSDQANVPDTASQPTPPEIKPNSWTFPFIGYGALAGLPIPCLGWVWLILSIVAANKLGWKRGALGMVLFLVAAVVVRLFVGFLITAGQGN